MKNKTEEQKNSATKPVENTTPQMDAAAILKEYDEIANYQKVLANHLLGKYDDKNEYKISDETILQALIETPKQFQDKRDGIVYACAKVAGFVLNFKIVYDIAESFCNADLYLIETESSFDEIIKHETHLGSLVEVYSPLFQEHTYNEWSVYKGEEIKDRNDKLYNVLHMQEQEFLFNKELTEILSQLYVLRMLPLLNGAGEEGYNAVGDFNALVQKFLKDDPTLAHDYTRLKLLLDRELKKKKLLAQILLNQEILRNMHAYSAPLKRVKDKTFAPMTFDAGKSVEKKEEKKAEKKAEPKKKAKKSASKKAEEKPAKKEEVKKKEEKEEPEWLKKLKMAPSPVGVQPSPTPKIAPKKVAPTKPAEPQPAQQIREEQVLKTDKEKRQEKLDEAKKMAQGVGIFSSGGGGVPVYEGGKVNIDVNEDTKENPKTFDVREDVVIFPSEFGQGIEPKHTNINEPENTK